MLVMPVPPAYPVHGLGPLRLKKAWSQEYLAEQAGIGRATVARAELGKPMRLATIRKLAAALGVAPAELLGE